MRRTSPHPHGFRVTGPPAPIEAPSTGADVVRRCAVDVNGRRAWPRERPPTAAAVGGLRLRGRSSLRGAARGRGPLRERRTVPVAKPAKALSRCRGHRGGGRGRSTGPHILIVRVLTIATSSVVVPWRRTGRGSSIVRAAGSICRPSSLHPVDTCNMHPGKSVVKCKFVARCIQKSLQSSPNGPVQTAPVLTRRPDRRKSPLPLAGEGTCGFGG